MGLFDELERLAKNVATEIGKNVKICPSCGAPASAEQKFCPSCGTQLPEETASQGAVCPSCGTQNTLGTNFCQQCGTKLPIAIQQEQAAQAKDAEVMNQWDQLLIGFPKWNCGGNRLHIEDYGEECYMFSASFRSHFEAQNAVQEYANILYQTGFGPAGQYPSQQQLYKMINGVCCHVDLEHCFEGDPETACIGFDYREPAGGFHYVKPQQKPQIYRNLKDLNVKDLKKLKGLFKF